MKRSVPDFDWNQARAFMATAQAGSLSAAARRLGLTQPTLGRQVAALEAALGVTLFERVGRSLALTQAGRALLEHVQNMGAAAEAVARAASHQSQTEEGLVRITASDVYAANVLPQALLLLGQRAPGIRVDVLASNSVNDLIRREADIAIRHVQPSEPDLIARRCPDSSARLYASEALYQRLGRPERRDQLADAPFIGPSERPDFFVSELNRRGVPITLDNLRYSTGSGLAYWQWVQAGLGIGAIMDPVAEATKGVRPVGDMEPMPVPVWLVTHRELRTSRRIRVVFDVLGEVLGGGHWGVGLPETEEADEGQDGRAAGADLHQR